MLELYKSRFPYCASCKNSDKSLRHRAIFIVKKKGFGVLVFFFYIVILITVDINHTSGREDLYRNTFKKADLLNLLFMY